MINQNLGELTRRQFLKLGGILAAGTAVGLPLEVRANSLFVELNDDNYNSEILNYEGPALVLFYRGDFEKAPPSKFEFEALKIVAQQYNGKVVERFGRKPIKFAVFDINQYNALPLSNQEKSKRLRDRYRLPPQEGVPVTLMYINGKLIDTKVGGPDSPSRINDTVHNVGKGWIPFNITNPNDSFTYLYKGGTQLRKYSKSS